MAHKSKFLLLIAFMLLFSISSMSVNASRPASLAPTPRVSVSPTADATKIAEQTGLDVIQPGNARGVVLLEDFRQPNLVRSIAVSPDGTLIALASGLDLIFMDSRTYLPATLAFHHAKAISTIKFSPDGQFIASAGADKEILIWDIKSGKKVKSFSVQSEVVNSIAYSPDGKSLLVGEGNHIRLFDMESGKETASQHLSDPVRAVAFSPDNHTVAFVCTSQLLTLWDTTTGNIQSLTVPTVKADQPAKAAQAITFSPNAVMLAVAYDNNTVELWDVAKAKRLRVLKGHTGAVYSAAFSPDGKVVATGSKDLTVRLWAAQTGATLAVLKDNSGSMFAAAFDKDGTRLLTGSYDNHLKAWGVPSANTAAQSGVRISGDINYLRLLPKVWLAHPGTIPRFTLEESLSFTTLQTCFYGEIGAFSLKRQRQSLTIKIINFKTRSTVASRTFTGGTPEVCAETESFSSSAPDRTVTGSDPSPIGIVDWIEGVLTSRGMVKPTS